MGGFSLLETMVVVAMLGVLAALAVPSVLPEVARARMDGAADGMAALVARARMEAVTSRRCVRFRLDGDRTAIVERRNAFECDAAAGVRAIDADRGAWIEVTKLVVRDHDLRVALSPAPSESGPDAVAAEMRFRPTGRLYSRDQDVQDDDAVVVVTNVASGDFKKVLVEAHGLVCTLDRNTDPLGAGNDLRCPGS